MLVLDRLTFLSYSSAVFGLISAVDAKRIPRATQQTRSTNTTCDSRRVVRNEIGTQKSVGPICVRSVDPVGPYVCRTEGSWWAMYQRRRGSHCPAVPSAGRARPDRRLSQWRPSDGTSHSHSIADDGSVSFVTKTIATASTAFSVGLVATEKIAPPRLQRR